MIASSALTQRAAASCAAVPLLHPCRHVSLSNEVRLVVGGVHIYEVRDVAHPWWGQQLFSDASCGVYSQVVVPW